MYNMPRKRYRDKNKTKQNKKQEERKEKKKRKGKWWRKDIELIESEKRKKREKKMKKKTLSDFNSLQEKSLIPLFKKKGKLVIGDKWLWWLWWR